MTLPIAVCVSGRGSNLQALIDAIGTGPRASGAAAPKGGAEGVRREDRSAGSEQGLDAEIVLVASSRAEAPALERARNAGIPTGVFRVTNASRSQAQGAMGHAIRNAGARLVVLAGYDRILADAFWDATGEIPVINIHPSLLPAFGRLNDMKVHEAVIASGVPETGATVHRAHRGKLDEGEIVVQRRVPVLPGDTPEILAQRVLAVEHEAIVEAVGRFIPTPAR